MIPANNDYKIKIAIIIPYRDRLVNLELLLRNLHPFLNRQNAYYGIYIVEPVSELLFNKGLSMNAGFIEASKEDDYDCFIFHDVLDWSLFLKNYFKNQTTYNLIYK